MEYEKPKFKPGDVVQFYTVASMHKYNSTALSLGKTTTPKDYKYEQFSMEENSWVNTKPITFIKFEGPIVGLFWDKESNEWKYEININEENTFFVPENTVDDKKASLESALFKYKSYILNELVEEQRKIKEEYENKVSQLNIKYMKFLASIDEQIKKEKER